MHDNRQPSVIHSHFLWAYHHRKIMLRLKYFDLEIIYDSFLSSYDGLDEINWGSSIQHVPFTYNDYFWSDSNLFFSHTQISMSSSTWISESMNELCHYFHSIILAEYCNNSKLNKLYHIATELIKNLSRIIKLFVYRNIHRWSNTLIFLVPEIAPKNNITPLVRLCPQWSDGNIQHKPWITKSVSQNRWKIWLTPSITV